VHQLRCYGNITRTLVYAGCARVADYWPAAEIRRKKEEEEEEEEERTNHTMKM